MKREKLNSELLAAAEQLGIEVREEKGDFSGGMCRVDDDKYITGLADLAESVHLWSGKICLQLAHAGRDTNLQATEGRQPVSTVC